MPVVGRLKNGDMLVVDEVDERLPVVRSGLIAHYPFDGTLNATIRPLQGAKVLAWRAKITMSDMFNYLNSNKAIITEVSDLTIVDVNTAKQYDLILADACVWEVPTKVINKLKEFTDAGVSCIAVGNDTRTNVFVKTYNSTGQVSHDILVESDVPYEMSQYTFAGAGNGDLIGGIVELQNGAYPLYRRGDNGLITGYMYDSPSGASLYFDQEGYVYGSPMKECFAAPIQYVLNRSRARMNASNTILMNDGVSVEEAVTNHIPISNMERYPIGYTGDVCGIGSNFRERFGVGNWRTEIIPVNDSPYPGLTKAQRIETYTAGWGGWVAGNIGPTTGNIVYGVWIRLWYGEIQWGDLNTSSRLYITTDTSKKSDPKYDVIEPGKWTYVTRTFPATASGRHLYANGVTKADIMAVQIETGDIPHMYVNGSKGNGNIELPIDIPGQNWTLFYRFTPTKNWASYYTTDYNRYMWYMYDDTGKKIWYSDWHMDGTFEYSWPWIGLDELGGSHYHDQRIKIVPGKEYIFAITKNGATFTKYVVSEYGYEADTFTYNDDRWINFHPVRLQFSSNYNHKIRDVSIYNRALSEDEIKKLVNSTFQLTPSGKLIASTIVESPILPSDVLYFPLDSRLDDIKGGYKATSSVANLLYTRDGVWVGQNYTNLLTQQSNGKFPVRSGKDLEVITFSPDTVIYRNKFTGETWNYNGQDIAVTAGQTYFVSVEIYVSTDFNGNYSMMASVEQTGGIVFEYDMTRKGVWQKFTHIFTPTSSGNSRFLLYPCPNNNSATQGYVLYRNPQFIASPFERPFINGNIGDGKLEFNLHRSIGLDWSKDWSIVYWKKPIGTHTNDLSGYNIESLGCNSNSVGGGYRWWGKDATSNAYHVSGMGSQSFSPTDYFGKWEMVSIVKQGNTITWKFWREKDVVMFQQTASISTANYFVTQYGYDFKLGGWDNNNPPNTYYRDLIVAKRALSDTELNAIARTQMRSYVGKLQIQGSLLENQTLR